MKSITNFARTATMLAIAASAAIASPALADTINVGNQYGVSAVGDRSDGYQTQLADGQHVDFASNPQRFAGAEACLATGGDLWPFKADFSIDPRRAAGLVCAPVGTDGRATIRINGRVPQGSTYVIRYSGGGYDWAGQDRVTVATSGS